MVPPSDHYNCIAWAAGFSDIQLWPGVPELTAQNVEWPTDLPQDESLASIVAPFESLGYRECDGPDVEAGYEKVALFSDPEEDYPTHASRQLPDGWWSSKMGWDGVTIEHDGLRCIEGRRYGRVRLYMRRPIG